MKKKIKIIMQITAVVLLAVILLSGCRKTDSSQLPTQSQEDTNESQLAEEKVEIGFAAPDFSIELLSGETVNLSDYRGKAVMINFWATWCPPCVGEMPDIQELSEAYPDDLVVLAVNCSEKKEKVENFIDENSYTFHIGLDDGTVQRIYPSDGIPYTVIVNPDGIITEIHLGAGGDMFTVYEEYIKTALEK